MSVRLWLVRHGVTDWSDAARLAGWTDIPLNDAGRFQAVRLGERLAGKTFAGIWSSDLRRATETARLAVGGASADRRLRELDFGRLEGTRWDQCSAPMREALLGFDGFKAPGGESVRLLRRRVLDFIDGLPDGEHVLFTHGGVIRLLLRERGRDEHVPPGEMAPPLRWRDEHATTRRRSRFPEGSAPPGERGAP